MPEIFRWAMLAVLLGAVTISGYHRAMARRRSETIPRSREEPLFQVLRAVMALALFGSVIIYVIYVVRPDSMMWASFGLPVWVRWLGVALGVPVVPSVHWVLRTLGSNVSETVFAKEHHQLVTTAHIAGSGILFIRLAWSCSLRSD